MIDKYPTRKWDVGHFSTRNMPATRNQNYSFFNENGYMIIKDFLGSYIINTCLVNEAKGLVTNEPGSKLIRSKTGIHNTYPFNEFLKAEHLLRIVKEIIGTDIYVHQSRINYKSNIGATGWHWHSDFETWHAQDGMPEMNCLTAMIPLTANTACNGPLMVIPKSHDLFYSCKKMPVASAQENFADQKEGLPDTEAIQRFFDYSGGEVEAIICNPGDLVLFDCNIIHGSVANITPLPRTNLFFVFNSIDNMLVAPFSADEQRPEEMGARLNIKVL